MNDSLNSEDKLVVSKAYDTIYLCEKRHCATFYGFLNEHEVQVIKDNVYLTEECLFWGGYSDARRVVFGCGENDFLSFPISSLCFTYKDEYKLSHRDFLGSLMALGIERSTIGDILVFDGQAIVFVKTEIAPYIKQEIRKIGRVGVKISDYDSSDFSYSQKYDELSFTVSSLRLDVFVSALCNLSREKASKLITTENVTVNYILQTSNSKTLNVGDVVTIKKYGKFVFTNNNGFSKKGRIRVLVKHFR